MMVLGKLKEKSMKYETIAFIIAMMLGFISVVLSVTYYHIKKDEAIRKICEGLTEVQIGKMKSLAESVEITTEGDFDNKLAVIRENYFPSKVQVKSEVKAIQEAAVNEEPEVVETSGIMAHYVKSLTKTAPKA